jgi:methionyl-tRNA formyltransferase
LVFQPEKLSQPGEFDRLKELRPDVIVVVAYGQILKSNVLGLPPLGCVNIHSSLLPRWRGAAPIQWAILGGDQETGVTTMRLVEALDAGDILLQAKTPILSEDTLGVLHDRLAKMGADLIVLTLQGLEAGTLKGIPQNEQQVTYASKLNKEMESLKFSVSAEIVDRQIRALNPWPGTSVWTLEGERLKIKKAKPRRDIQGPEGKIFERAGMVMLGVREGALELLQLQWDGKKEISPGEFLNGLRGRGKALPLELQCNCNEK